MDHQTIWWLSRRHLTQHICVKAYHMHGGIYFLLAFSHCREWFSVHRFGATDMDDISLSETELFLNSTHFDHYMAADGVGIKCQERHDGTVGVHKLCHHIEETSIAQVFEHSKKRVWLIGFRKCYRRIAHFELSNPYCLDWSVMFPKWIDKGKIREGILSSFFGCVIEYLLWIWNGRAHPK